METGGEKREGYCWDKGLRAEKRGGLNVGKKGVGDGWKNGEVWGKMENECWDKEPCVPHISGINSNNINLLVAESLKVFNKSLREE